MRVICTEGTWAREPWGLLGETVSLLPYSIERVNYPEQYGDAFSYNESVYIGKRALRKKLSKISEPFILIGYSQGAHIAGDVALEYRDDDNLKAVYLIADPKRSPRDRLVGPETPGKGVFGSRPIGPKAVHFAAPGDIIAANTNNFISNVAWYTLEKKKFGAKEWLRTFKAARSQRQPGGKMWTAIQEVRYYLKTQVHTSYNSYIVDGNLTVPQWIAHDIARIANMQVKG